MTNVKEGTGQTCKDESSVTVKTDEDQQVFYRGMCGRGLSALDNPSELRNGLLLGFDFSQIIFTD